MTPLYNGMLPPSLVHRLADVWPSGKHVVTEYGERFPDASLWAEARAGGYTIITKDSDFSDGARFPGPPPQVVRLTIGNTTPDQIEAYLRGHAAEIEAFAATSVRYCEV